MTFLNLGDCKGKFVKLHGLNEDVALNGRIGMVQGITDKSAGRLKVFLFSSGPDHNQRGQTVSICHTKVSELDESTCNINEEEIARIDRLVRPSYNSWVVDEENQDQMIAPPKRPTRKAAHEREKGPPQSPKGAQNTDISIPVGSYRRRMSKPWICDACNTSYSVETECFYYDNNQYWDLVAHILGDGFILCDLCSKKGITADTQARAMGLDTLII
jgi:hypothetical protein